MHLVYLVGFVEIVLSEAHLNITSWTLINVGHRAKQYQV